MQIAAVTSGKGGTGKSCVAAYTALAMGAAGGRVLLVEQGVRSLDLILGVQDQIVYDVWDVLAGRCTLEQALVTSPIQKNVDLLPAGLSLQRPLGAQPELERLLDSARLEYDLILLDDPIMEFSSPDFLDATLLVVTPESLCIRPSAQKARELYEAGFSHLRLVINNVPAQVIPIYGAEDFDDIIDLVGAQLLAVIPASPKLQYSANNAKPLSEESLTPKVFEALAARLRGEHRPLLVR